MLKQEAAPLLKTIMPFSKWACSWEQDLPITTKWELGDQMSGKAFSPWPEFNKSTLAVATQISLMRYSNSFKALKSSDKPNMITCSTTIFKTKKLPKSIRKMISRRKGKEKSWRNIICTSILITTDSSSDSISQSIL